MEKFINFVSHIIASSFLTFLWTLLTPTLQTSKFVIAIAVGLISPLANLAADPILRGYRSDYLLKRLVKVAFEIANGAKTPTVMIPFLEFEICAKEVRPNLIESGNFEALSCLRDCEAVLEEVQKRKATKLGALTEAQREVFIALTQNH